MDAITCLTGRRSAAQLTGPGPDAAELELILTAATTVPDHGRLRPWRFVVVQGDARDRLGDALAAATLELDPAAPPEAVAKQRGKPLAAPTLVVLVATPRPGRIPEWEQVASAACTGQSMALAAHALGLGAVWKSTKLSDARALRDVLDLDDSDVLLGWVLLGHHAPGRTPAPRPAVRLDDVVRHLAPAGP